MMFLRTVFFRRQEWPLIHLHCSLPEATVSFFTCVVDNFTRWQNALAIPDATATVVPAALDEMVICSMGLPEQIHTDQAA